MALPANWNNATISVDPWVLKQASGAVTDAIKAINDDMTAITNKLNDLRLSWGGKAQQEAQDYEDQWNEIWEKLYGTQGHPYGSTEQPGEGLLNRFSRGIGQAAVNYSHGERLVANSFASFQAAVESVGDTSNPDGVGDTSKWNLPPGTNIEDEIGSSAHPVQDEKTTGDDTSAPPAKPTIDDPGPGNIHSTAVNETF